MLTFLSCIFTFPLFFFSLSFMWGVEIGLLYETDFIELIESPPPHLLPFFPLFSLSFSRPSKRRALCSWMVRAQIAHIERVTCALLSLPFLYYPEGSPSLSHWRPSFRSSLFDYGYTFNLAACLKHSNAVENSQKDVSYCGRVANRVDILISIHPIQIYERNGLTRLLFKALFKWRFDLFFRRQ